MGSLPSFRSHPTSSDTALQVISFSESAVADECAGEAGEGNEVLGFAFVSAVKSAAAGEPGQLSNDGEAALELTVQPRAETHQLLPKQTWVVVTYSSAADGSWSGTLREDEPFQVDHRPESVTVRVDGNCFHLSDTEGNVIESAD
ncbi:hypothetical protein GCM10010280_66050 [Streptomyces pilosus]|uniref:Uncharacterized protein n=1 Tax=Streptomyces pilosus TaxID=28893 RepID=A0A918F6D3_9ACTN|nr:hypothetical protein GCM10010280_66050 [Streptomyces pilosus]